MRLVVFILCGLAVMAFSYLASLLRGFVRAKAEMERAD